MWSSSVYWKLVEEHFKNSFVVKSVDENLWEDKLHFKHHFIRNYHETVSLETYRMFSSTELQSMWRELQKEYDKVFTNFKKSSNHRRSFTRAAMVVYQNQNADEVDIPSDASFDSADSKDELRREVFAVSPTAW
jgi:hypothetical protein